MHHFDVMHGYLHYLEIASIKINTLFCVKSISIKEDVFISDTNSFLNF